MKRIAIALAATMMLTQGCGDSTTGPQEPTTIVGFVEVLENPTPGYPRGYGFGDMYGYWRFYEERYGTCHPRHCWELAVTNGADTVYTDDHGNFRFDSLPPGNYRIHVVEQMHPRHHVRYDGTDSCVLGEDGSSGCRFQVPTTFWHFVGFDTLTVTVNTGGVVSDTIRARQRTASIVRLLITEGWATRPVEGVRVETTLDTISGAVFETRVTDQYGETVMPTPYDRCAGNERSCTPAYYTRIVDEQGEWGARNRSWRRFQLRISTLCRPPRLVHPCAGGDVVTSDADAPPHVATEYDFDGFMSLPGRLSNEERN